MGHPPAGAVPFGMVSEAQTFSVRTGAVGVAASPLTSISPSDARYGAVPFWKIGTSINPCSSSNAGLAAPHRRSPLAIGHGDVVLLSLQSVQPVTVGAAAALTETSIFFEAAVGSPTVNTVAVVTDVGSIFVFAR